LYIDEVKDKKEIMAFTKKHLQNRRNATRKKAEKLSNRIVNKLKRI